MSNQENSQALKAVTIEILNHCVFNKTIFDFNLIKDLIKVIESDKAVNVTVSESITGIFISGFFDGWLFSFKFHDNDTIMLTLPNDNLTTYTIVNDGYNAQYAEIKTSLSKYL